MYDAGKAIDLVLYLAILVMLARFVGDIMQMFARGWSPRGPLLVFFEGVYSLTDPPIRTIRRILPPLRLGGVMIDLSFLVVLLILYLLRYLNGALLL